MVLHYLAGSENMNKEEYVLYYVIVLNSFTSFFCTFDDPEVWQNLSQ